MFLSRQAATITGFSHSKKRSTGSFFYVQISLWALSLTALSEAEHCFDEKSTSWGFPAMIPLSKLDNEDGGFLVDNKVMIFAEIDVFEVIGTLNETEKSQEASGILSKRNENVVAEYNDFLKKTSPEKESNDANGTKQEHRYISPGLIIFIQPSLNHKNLRFLSVASLSCLETV